MLINVRPSQRTPGDHRSRIEMQNELFTAPPHLPTHRCHLALRAAERSFVVLFLLAVMLRAEAASVTYTFTGVGSGTVDAASFTDAAFAIRVVADTDQIIQFMDGRFRIFSVEDLSSSIEIVGIGSGEFDREERVFVNQTSSALGFSHSIGEGGVDLLDIGHPSFATYDLSTSFGPVVGIPLIDEFSGEPSTLGSILLFSAHDISFNAVVVPEPSSILVLAAGSFVAALFGRCTRTIK